MMLSPRPRIGWIKIDVLARGMDRAVSDWWIIHLGPRAQAAVANGLKDLGVHGCQGIRQQLPQTGIFSDQLFLLIL